LSIRKKAARIKLLLFDVDGVLTDGKILLHADGSESKQFDIRDGTGLVWAQKAGLQVGFLSARASVATTQRAAQLGISLVRQADASKLRAYDEILRQHGYQDGDVAYMGDDVLDVPIIERVGLSACPADASPDVRSRVDYVCRAGGGNGAARELVELVLRTQDRWQALLAGHDAEPGQTTGVSTGKPRVTRFPRTESRGGKS
jgi:3-deoxy-D-manno-octulosonate 8-phosphate phosphatase (KDO 8-P phosphatase)